MKQQGHIKNTLLSGFFLVLLGSVGTADAAPTGEDLLHACNVSIESGFDNMTGSMCSWYVTPCNCDTALPEVCLPDPVSIRSLAGEVVSGLAERPELKSEPAATAAALILSEIYPCGNDATD